MKAEFYKPLEAKRFEELAAQIQNPDDSLVLRAAKRLKLFLEEERIIKVQGTRIPAWRTITEFPDIYAAGEKKRLQAGHFVHEQGRVCNISSDWQGVLESGLIPRRAKAEENLKNGIGEAEFLKAAILTIDAVVAYADRYEIPTLSRAIRYGASHFEDALQTMRILHFALWASNVYHNTIGRFDQYMWPYLKKDLENGILTEQEALELLEEFFLSFNRDSALYTGMQQGDNGQSLMLGGCDAQGNCTVNKLTFLCLDASLHNRTIDPKINLRVDRNTSMELYEKATMLTRQGLGFPQYSNDDVVIPALVRFGYSLEDARNYTVAACWEFIIPGVGMDIPNISAVCLATALRTVIIVRVHDCKRPAHQLSRRQNRMRRSPRLCPPLRNTVALREIVQLLIRILNMHRTGETVPDCLMERLLDLALDNKNHSLKARALRVIDRIIQQKLTVIADRVNLLQSAVAAAHTGSHNDQYRLFPFFSHFNSSILFPAIHIKLAKAGKRNSLQFATILFY